MLKFMFSSDFDHDSGVASSAGTSVLERPVTWRVDAGDHEKLAHYVRKEKIVESAVTGSPVVALCGKVWTPGQDPEKFPVCPECREIYETLKAEGE